MTEAEKEMVEIYRDQVRELKKQNAEYIEALREKDEQLAKFINQTTQLIGALKGTAKSLQRVLDKHDPDSTEYEWVGEANEIILKLTGKNLREA